MITRFKNLKPNESENRYHFILGLNCKLQATFSGHNWMFNRVLQILLLVPIVIYSTILYATVQKKSVRAAWEYASQQLHPLAVSRSGRRSTSRLFLHQLFRRERCNICKPAKMRCYSTLNIVRLKLRRLSVFQFDGLAQFVWLWTLQFFLNSKIILDSSSFFIRFFQNTIAKAAILCFFGLQTLLFRFLVHNRALTLCRLSTFVYDSCWNILLRASSDVFLITPAH